MSRKNQRPYSASTLMSLAFVLVAGVTFAAFFINRGCDTTSTSNQNASASPTPATNAAGSAAPNQPSPGASQANATANQAQENAVNHAITGTVKKEGSGEIVTDAVVVLFSGDKRGARPQMIDSESGQFKFDSVPLRPGVTYSLQTKLPGLCGEESINLPSVNAQQTIHRDIFLKPCQSTATVQTPTPAKAEDPSLKGISDGLSGILAPLNTVKVWIQILATTWILTMVMLLSVTLAYLIPLRNKISQAHQRINLLVEDGKRKVETEGSKTTQGSPTTTLFALPTEVSQTLKQVLGVLQKIELAIRDTAGQTNQDREHRREEPPQRPATYTTPAYQSQAHSPSPEPGQWYQHLVQGEARNPAPLYVEINDNTSENDPLYKRRICFDERAHGSFVVFRQNEETGWIFPRPNSTWLADHRRVFGELEQKNVEQQKPKEVIFQEGYWQLLL